MTFVMAAAVVDWDALTRYGRSHLRCPRPTKLFFPSQMAAVEQFIDLIVRDSHLEVYSCCCGSWHAGHPRSILRPFARAPERPLTQQLGTTLTPEVLDRLRQVRDA
jgi:hypothetical protein